MRLVVRLTFKRRIILHHDSQTSPENRTGYLPNARQMCYVRANVLGW
jgi:hypothetical protein